jgi:hypothetical protein
VLAVAAQPIMRGAMVTSTTTRSSLASLTTHMSSTDPVPGKVARISHLVWTGAPVPPCGVTSHSTCGTNRGRSFRHIANSTLKTPSLLPLSSVYCTRTTIASANQQDQRRRHRNVKPTITLPLNPASESSPSIHTLSPRPCSCSRPLVRHRLDSRRRPVVVRESDTVSAASGSAPSRHQSTKPGEPSMARSATPVFEPIIITRWQKKGC